MVKRTTAHRTLSHTEVPADSSGITLERRLGIKVKYSHFVQIQSPPSASPSFTDGGSRSGMRSPPPPYTSSGSHGTSMHDVYGTRYMAPSRSPTSRVQIQWRPGLAMRCQKLTYAKGKVSITFPRCSNGKSNIQGKPGGCKLDPYSV